MHPSAYAFAATALDPAEIKGKRVIEAGALDVNGTARGAVEAHGPASYTATDMRPGPGVDVVCDAADIPAMLGYADVIISTEMMEHAADWKAAMNGLVAAIAPGGVLVLTTRGPGFPLHGYPDDHWRFTPETMGQIVKAAGLEIERLEPDPDPYSPGVFVKARKPDGWHWPKDMLAAWDDAEVGRP